MTVGVRRKLLVKDGTTEREVPLAGTVSVGRDPSCEISSNDPALSRHHAEFLETGRGILVRDLRSQNGIKVNSVVVREAVLQPGDVVTIAGLIMRYAEDGAPPQQVVAPPTPATAPIAPLPRAEAAPPPPPPPPPPAAVAPPPPPPPAPPAPPPPEPAPVPLAAVLPPSEDAHAGDDSTRVAAPSPFAPPHAPPPPPPPAAAAHVPLANLVGPAPGAATGDSDRTNMMSMPQPARATNAMPIPVAAPAPVPTRPRVSATGRAAQEFADSKAKPATRYSWAANVLWRVLMLCLLVSLLSAIPLMVWHQQQMNAVTVSRATALANLLASDATVALTTGKDLESAPNQVLEQSGVIAARILAIDGRVMAPAPRSAENITAIPGINSAPGDILRLRAEWNGDRLEVVRPVAAKGNPRAALAWVTISPTTEFNGSSLVVTAPVVVISLLLGWIVATWLITNPTQRGFAKLNEDVELALSGRAETVRDPVGAKPITDLTNTINYLVARLHSGESLPVAPASEGGPEPSRRSTLVVATPSSPSPVTPPVVITPPTPRMGTPAPAPPPPAPVRAAAPPPPAAPAPAAAASGVEARILVDTGFHVTEASPGCAALLGVRPDSLVGRHLLDAIADRQIADAVLGCLSALPPAGERQAVTADGSGRRLVATISRSGKDKPITITLRPAE